MKLPTFDANDYEREAAMHIKTHEQYEIFCEYLDSIGRRWYSGDSYIVLDHFGTYSNQTVMYFNQGMYGSKENASGEVLRFDDFDWSITPPSPDVQLTFDQLF